MTGYACTIICIFFNEGNFKQFELHFTETWYVYFFLIKHDNMNQQGMFCIIAEVYVAINSIYSVDCNIRQTSNKYFYKD